MNSRSSSKYQITNLGWSHAQAPRNCANVMVCGGAATFLSALAPLPIDEPLHCASPNRFVNSSTVIHIQESRGPVETPQLGILGTSPTIAPASTTSHFHRSIHKLSINSLRIHPQYPKHTNHPTPSTESTIINTTMLSLPFITPRDVSTTPHHILTTLTILPVPRTLVRRLPTVQINLTTSKLKRSSPPTCTPNNPPRIHALPLPRQLPLRPTSRRTRSQRPQTKHRFLRLLLDPPRGLRKDNARHEGGGS